MSERERESGRVKGTVSLPRERESERSTRCSSRNCLCLVSEEDEEECTSKAQGKHSHSAVERQDVG